MHPRFAALVMIAGAAMPLPAFAQNATNTLDGLVGCWKAPGQVMGKPVQNFVRGTKRLDGKYLVLELNGTDVADPYDAAVVLGARDDKNITSFWLDSFGAGGSAKGDGTAIDGKVEINFPYPDAVYTNRLVKAGSTWRWTINTMKPDGSAELFADYTLSAVACKGKKFKF